MERFTRAGRNAVEAENWYGALTIALMIPDICGSLEDPGLGKVAKRYIKWAKEWLQPEFVGGPPDHKQVYLSAENIFQARNSLLHSGSAEIEPSKRKDLDRFEFFSDGPHLCMFSGCYHNGKKQPDFLQVNVGLFCETVYKQAEAWDAAMQQDEAVQREKENLLVIYPPGTTIRGICFG